MSWQTYVDSNLVGTGKIAKAAIIGLDGGIWASSNGYQVTQPEEQAIRAMYNDTGKFVSEGVRLAGRKLFGIQVLDRTLIGQNKADGVILVKTGKAILVAEFVAPTQAPEARVIVETLADYLVSVGY